MDRARRAPAPAGRRPPRTWSDPRDHQITGQCQVRSHSCRGSVDSRDHRHVTVDQRREQRVLAVEHHPSGVADDLLGHVVAALRVTVSVAQVGAGAEEPLPGGCDHRAAGTMARVEAVEDVSYSISARRVQRVGGLRSVNGDPRHALAVLEAHLLVDSAVCVHRRQASTAARSLAGRSTTRRAAGDCTARHSRVEILSACSVCGSSACGVSPRWGQTGRHGEH